MFGKLICLSTLDCCGRTIGSVWVAFDSTIRRGHVYFCIHNLSILYCCLINPIFEFNYGLPSPYRYLVSCVSLWIVRMGGCPCSRWVTLCMDKSIHYIFQQWYKVTQHSQKSRLSIIGKIRWSVPWDGLFVSSGLLTRLFVLCQHPFSANINTCLVVSIYSACIIELLLFVCFVRGWTIDRRVRGIGNGSSSLQWLFYCSNSKTIPITPYKLGYFAG